MKTAKFIGQCSIEIGDKVEDASGNIHTVTDICCMHYVKSGKIEFLLELDGSGKWAQLHGVETASIGVLSELAQ